jgi:hypothetical protein
MNIGYSYIDWHAAILVDNVNVATNHYNLALMKKNVLEQIG